MTRRIVHSVRSAGKRVAPLRKMWRVARSKPRARAELSEELRQTLVESFRDDIQLLGDLLKRDLSHWLCAGGRPIPASQHPVGNPQVKSAEKL